MAFTIKEAVEKLHQLEAAAPGFVAALKTDFESVESNPMLNTVLQHLSPGAAAWEKSALDKLESACDVFSSKLASLKYLDQLIDLFTSLNPSA